MRHPHPALIASLAAVALTMAPDAGASIGTGVGATPLTLTAPAHAGRRYVFPWLYVKNTGSSSSDYQVRVQRISPGGARSIPVSWVQLTPRAFHLAPRAIRRVVVSVAVPSGAASGSYATDLVASTSSAHTARGTALGAAAADGLSFRIPSSSTFPWLLIVIGAGVAGLAAAVFGVRRSGVRVRLDLSRGSPAEPRT